MKTRQSKAPASRGMEKRVWVILRSLMRGDSDILGGGRGPLSFTRLGRALGVSRVAVAEWDKRHEVPAKYHKALIVLWFASLRKGRDLITSYEVGDWGNILGREAVAEAVLKMAARVYKGTVRFNRCATCYASRWPGGANWAAADRVCSEGLDPDLCADSGVFDPIDEALARAVEEGGGRGEPL